MPTGTTSRNKKDFRSLYILIGYNFPFILWTIAALIKAESSISIAMWSCPVERFLGFCPGCGLTREYTKFLKGQGIESLWFAALLFFFVANFFYSLFKAYRIRKASKEKN
ncbi:MAG: DUF2752 domain-containing protein, partial [Candidatus Aureabacteria bacterium]|nr:DUF2752 domain-containing protein [Candidatus Auribacterota bacterium]